MNTPSPLDAFIPRPDVRERFHVDVHAPAREVMAVASEFDLQSPPLVRAIIRMREILMRAAPATRQRKPQGLLAETRELGWGLLLERPGRLIVCGASCRPWQADPHFTAIPAEAFAAFSEPQLVKIAWSLEAVAIAPALTRFRHETRVLATDAEARRRFRTYWRWARFGIVAIRLLWMPSIRREAERRWRAGPQRAGATTGQ